LGRRRRCPLHIVHGEDELLPCTSHPNRLRPNLRTSLLRRPDRGRRLRGVLRQVVRQIKLSHLLSFVVFLPLAGLAVLAALPAGSKRLIRLWANAIFLAGFLVSVPLVTNFDHAATGYQFVERASWIPSIGAQYLIGIDGISLLLVMLTTVIGFIAS